MSGAKGKKGKKLYSSKYGFTLYQQNGQRTYGGPPPNWGSRPPPSRDCEVFIGRLPRMCFEDELIPLFRAVGELYEFRLMLDFSGTNRGYGYAHYATPAGAQRAIEKLNKYEIRPGHQIGVLKSKNNCRLLFGNIGPSLAVETFNEFIRNTTDQVLNVLMFKNFQQLKQTDFRISAEVEEAFLGRMPRNNGNNQFAIVEYENHKAAAVARRVLIPKYGHILAIDWAVPPRERKRTGPGPDSQILPIERPLSTMAMNDSNLTLLLKSTSKVRPVPVLLVQPSPFDSAPFLPKTFRTVVKFFKYLLSVCLYKCVDKLEIPLFICKEIERKIVDRITDVQNCSQAVQLIFNYFSWYNEKKRYIINLEAHQLLQEVKAYADLFSIFIHKRLKHGPSQDLAKDNYYTHVLPLQLNILFRIILRSDAEQQAKLCSGITSGLKLIQKADKSSSKFMEEIMNLVKNEEPTSLDKASSLAKSLFLNSVIANQESQNIVNSMMMDLSFSNAIDPASIVENAAQIDGNQGSLPTTLLSLPFQRMPSDLNLQNLKGIAGHFIPMPFSQISKFREEITKDSSAFPLVPLLVVQPSIMTKVPFMPKTFYSILTFFEYLIKVCVNVNAVQMSIPHYICIEIKRRIIDRISNMENCSEGVQLILNYLTRYSEEKACTVNIEARTLLQEVKDYADYFVNFVWNKAMSVYIPDDVTENYSCKILPLRLNLLFHMLLIFKSENRLTSLLGITKGLNWLEDFFQRGDKKSKEFLEELTRFIVESDTPAYERAKSIGKAFCADLVNRAGQPIGYEDVLFPFPKGDIVIDKSFFNSPPNAEESSNLAVTGGDSASDTALDYYS